MSATPGYPNVAPPAGGEPVEPFVTPDELRVALNTDLEESQAQWLCDSGSAAVRAEVMQTVNIVEQDEVLLDGSGSVIVLLPELEVRAVHSVALHDQELEADVDYAWNRAGCLWRVRSPGVRVPRWPVWPRCLRVTYDHGWSVVSAQWDAARHVAIEVAARMFHNPEMLQSEQLGSYARRWATASGRAELTDTEKRSLDCLRTGV